MSSHQNESETPSGDDQDPTIEEQSGTEGQDQDADPSLNAPEGGPDGQG